ncbi:hypothetical protein [uncultured Shewanella sp.]|nr:hypothetical protein [uncultured Shewanella sp.]
MPAYNITASELTQLTQLTTAMKHLAANTTKTSNERTFISHG